MDKKVRHRQLDKYHGFFPARGARYLRESKYLTKDEYSSLCGSMGVPKFHEGYMSAIKLDRKHFKSDIVSNASVSTAKSFFELLLNLILAHRDDFNGPSSWPMKQVIYVAESLLASIFHHHINKRSGNTKINLMHDVEQTMKKVNKAKSLYDAIKIIRKEHKIPESLDIPKQSLSTARFDESSLSKTEVQNGLTKGEVVVGDTSISIDPSITSSSSQTPTPDPENVTEIVKQSITDATSINIGSNITPPLSSPISTPFSTEAIQEFSRSKVKRELEEIDDCIVVVEPPAKKSKIEYNETFAFEHPSTSILKEICKKLNLEYSHDAYKFWANIVFQNVVSASNNIKPHSFKSKNIFACLCQFFTGKTKSCFLFQDAINSALFDELTASGIMPLKEIEKFCTSNIVFDEHVEFIAKYLSCRIGIYENGILRKFGKWQNNDDSLTLILLFEDELYSVVLDL